MADLSDPKSCLRILPAALRIDRNCPAVADRRKAGIPGIAGRPAIEKAEWPAMAS